MGNFFRDKYFDMLNWRIGQYFVTHILSCILFVLPSAVSGRSVCLAIANRLCVVKKRYVSTALLSFCDRIIRKTIIVLRFWIKESNILAGEYAL
jgi:hypothetical protein